MEDRFKSDMILERHLHLYKQAFIESNDAPDSHLDQVSTAGSASDCIIHSQGTKTRDATEDKDNKSIRSDISATDLAAARAEIWILRKSLSEARVSIENLENLVKTILEKQNVMLTEMYHLKRSNFELQEECRMQRDYQTMERNAMLRELHDIKLLLNNRSKDLEESLTKNRELVNSIDDCHEKIYIMGMKYMKLKKSTHGYLSEQSYSSGQSECSENSEESDQSE